MKLKTLIKGIPQLTIQGARDVSITGICAHSSFVVPGNLFIARKGARFDGSQFIPEAVLSGAIAVLTDIFDPSLKSVTQLLHPDPQSIEAELAKRFYQNPSQNLYMVGITGTNGKTTSAYLMKAVLEHVGVSTGLISSIEYQVGCQRYQASHTTPDVLTCQKLLKEMQIKACQAAVMEVTSHALIQERVKGIEFDAALFTNLTQDHLDYHGTMEGYAVAKRKLFEHLVVSAKKNPVAVVNADDPYVEAVTAVPGLNRTFYGLSSGVDVQAEEVEQSVCGTTFTVCAFGQRSRVHLPLIGLFNVYNALGVIAIGLARSIPLEIICEALSQFSGVPGRLERVPNAQNLQIFVDFSHTPAALEHTLRSLHALCKGRIFCIFGCGGDRDQTKRPLMAQAVEKWADVSIVTSDNPRREDPECIAQEIIQGFKNPDAAVVQLDRRQAIAHALSEVHEEDIVLIAGKGHETYQIFAHKTVDFDDRQVASELCEEKPLKAQV